MGDYAKRESVNEHFQNQVRALHRARIPEGQVINTNEYFPLWIGPLFSALYIWSNAETVLKGDMKVGVFLAMLGIFQSISEDFSDLYHLTIKLARSVGPVRTLTLMFNAETDLYTWKEVGSR